MLLDAVEGAVCQAIGTRRVGRCLVGKVGDWELKKVKQVKVEQTGGHLHVTGTGSSSKAGREHEGLGARQRSIATLKWILNLIPS